MIEGRDFLFREEERGEYSDVIEYSGGGKFRCYGRCGERLLSLGISGALQEQIKLLQALKEDFGIIHDAETVLAIRCFCSDCQRVVFVGEDEVRDGADFVFCAECEDEREELERVSS